MWTTPFNQLIISTNKRNITDSRKSESLGYWFSIWEWLNQKLLIGMRQTYVRHQKPCC